MKNRFFISCCCIILIFSNVNGQDGDPPQDGAAITRDVYGNPFLLKDWSDGVIHFTSGRVVKQFKIKFNCAENMVMLQFNGSTFSAESKVDEFVIYPRGNKKDSMVFKKGFPDYKKANKESFYQVLAEGKLTLLKQCMKEIIEERKLVKTTDNVKRYEDKENYFLLQNGVMTLLEHEKSFEIRLLPESFDALKQIVARDKLNPRSDAELTRLVNSFNGL